MFKDSKLNSITVIKSFTLQDYVQYLIEHQDDSGEVHFNEKCTICLSELFDFNFND